MTPSFIAYRLPHSAHPQFAKIEWNRPGYPRLSVTSFEGKRIDGALSDCEKNEFNFYFEGGRPHLTSKEEYLNQGHSILRLFEEGKARKVVLSRVKWVDGAVDIWKTFDRLVQSRQDAFAYVFSDPELGTWMGITPEILLQSSKDELKTHSLAGTKPADNQDRWGNKEIEEQQMVTDYIVQSLSELGLNPVVGIRETVTAGPVAHLRTLITSKLDVAVSSNAIVERLHPTPAVCGIPLASAKQAIKAVEKHDRKLYTGHIGVIQKDSQTTFVNLRCMQIFRDGVALFVGGGWTTQSIPEDEWIETENKANTLLNLIER